MTYDLRSVIAVDTLCTSSGLIGPVEGALGFLTVLGEAIDTEPFPATGEPMERPSVAAAAGAAATVVSAGGMALVAAVAAVATAGFGMLI